jgi:hypothetical protein
MTIQLKIHWTHTFPHRQNFRQLSEFASVLTQTPFPYRFPLPPLSHYIQSNFTPPGSGGSVIACAKTRKMQKPAKLRQMIDIGSTKKKSALALLPGAPGPRTAASNFGENFVMAPFDLPFSPLSLSLLQITECEGDLWEFLLFVR